MPRGSSPSPAPRVVIRRYRPGKDGGWLGNLPAAGSPRAAARGEDASSWVAEVDGRVVAVCTWRWLPPLEQAAAAITRLWVDQAMRRRGLATRVYLRALSEMRKTFRKAGVRLRTLSVEADRSDPAADAFLRKCKFTLDEHGARRTFDAFAADPEADDEEP